MKQFDEWNKIKKETEDEKVPVFFKERDIFWVRVGENIGYEQNGKGDEFQRPVIIVKKYSPQMFLGIPLSTTHRDGSFFYPFSFAEDKSSTALLIQHKLFSSKRLMKKIGKISTNDFGQLKEKLVELIR